MSDRHCCRAMPISGRRRTKIQVLYCGSAEADTGLVGESPRGEGRGGTAFGKQYHLADVSSGIMISEVIG